MEALEQYAKEVAADWAKQYAAAFEGAAEDVAEFFEYAGADYAAAIAAGDEQGVRLLEASAYLMVRRHRLRLQRAHRKTVQRGLSLFFAAIRGASIILGQGAVAVAATAAERLVPDAD